MNSPSLPPVGRAEAKSGIAREREGAGGDGVVQGCGEAGSRALRCADRRWPAAAQMLAESPWGLARKNGGGVSFSFFPACREGLRNGKIDNN
jgi:hypothetical protein